MSRALTLGKLPVSDLILRGGPADTNGDDVMSITPIIDSSNWPAAPATPSASSSDAGAAASSDGSGAGRAAATTPDPSADDARVEARTTNASTSSLLSSLGNSTYTSSGSLATTPAKSDLRQGIDILA